MDQYEHAYKNIINKSFVIQTILEDSNWFLGETELNVSNFDKSNSRDAEFWNKYLYPRFEKVYFELFPSDKSIDLSQGKVDILLYNQKLIITFCELIKRIGFFHSFDNQIYFIKITPQNIGSILINGIPVKNYSLEILPQYITKLIDNHIKSLKWYKKINSILQYVIVILIILVFVLFSIL